MGPLVGAALVKGGANLAGGLLSNRAAKKAYSRDIREERFQWDRALTDRESVTADDREYEKQLYQRSRNAELQDRRNQFKVGRLAAEEAGFNPLTTLGIAAPAPTQLPKVGSAQLLTGGNVVAPVSQFGQITDGLASFGEVLSGVTAQKQAVYDMEMEQAKARLRQANTSLAPQVGPRAPAREKTPQPGDVVDGQVVFKDAAPIRTDPHATTDGDKLSLIDSRQQDAASWAERYGEPGEWVGAAKIAWKDAAFAAFAHGISKSHGDRAVREFVKRYGDPKNVKRSKESIWSAMRKEPAFQREGRSVTSPGQTEDAKNRRTQSGGY